MNYILPLEGNLDIPVIAFVGLIAVYAVPVFLIISLILAVAKFRKGAKIALIAAGVCALIGIGICGPMFLE